MYRIGIDLGGTNIAVGLVNEFCRIVTKKSTPTLAKRESDDITADMARLCLEVCAEAKTPITEIESIGIATPGIANLDNGCVEYSCNLPFRRYPIVKKLASMLDIDESKIKIANDANAAAYGEAVAGAARGSSDSIMVTLGTGVGGGIILGGKILTGFNHAAGEIGHIVIETNGAQCGCGRRGCWEAYSSATGLSNMTKEKMKELKLKGISSILFDEAEKDGKVSARTAFNAMKRGDKYGAMVVDEYIKYLAEGITNIINIFQPEILTIGGGVCNEKEYLTKPLLEIVESEQYTRNNVNKTKVVTAVLGNDAGIIGAAVLGM